MDSITIRAVFRGNQIVPLDKELLRAFKDKLKEETPINLTISNGTLRSQQAFAFFHVCVHRWATYHRIDNESAKMQLKIMYGVAEEYTGKEWMPPHWSGRFAEYDMKIFYAKTTNEYTRTEMKELTDRCIDACVEAGIDVADLVFQKSTRRTNDPTEEAKEAQP